MEGDVSFADRLGKIDISIHALRVEGDARCLFVFRDGKISIHALRVEGDSFTCLCYGAATEISIHALRVEGDGS